jgi:hypothetical protein
MRPNLPTITATLATRDWVRQRRKALGREPTDAELCFFIHGRYAYLDPADRDYVYSCALQLPPKYIGEKDG